MKLFFKQIIIEFIIEPTWLAGLFSFWLALIS